jgi:hypothetical protein
MKFLTRDDFVFESTGRKETANCGILGLGIDDDGELTVTEGYDGGFGSQRQDSPDKWTREERKELAAYMVKQWEVFGRGGTT